MGLFKERLNIYYLKKRDLPLPQTVMIEPTDACNLKCIMCDVQNSKATKARFLSLKDFEFIISQFREIRELVFCGIGEPLLNPDIFGMIKLAKLRGVQYVNLITNGNLLSEINSRGLIEAGVDRIQVSIHSFNSDSFMKIRRGGIALSELKDNIATLVKLKESYKAKFCICGVCVLNKINYAHMRDFIDECKRLNMDRLEFFQLTTILGKLDSINVPLAEMRKLVREAKKHAKKKGIAVGFLNGNSCGRCYQMWDFVMIHVDGNLGPCNGIMPTENIGLGNIFERPIEEIWSSEKYNGLRRKVILGELKNCRYCESGYLMEGRDIRWAKNYYLRPFKRILRAWLS